MVAPAARQRLDWAMIKNVILDWSGTLVDDLPAVLEATNYVLAQAGRPEMTLDQFRSEFSLPFTGFYLRHTPDVPPARLEEWFHTRFPQVQHTVRELPHARRFLEFCRANGLRTFLLSSVHPAYYAAQAEATGLGGFIDVSYAGVWDKRAKINEILRDNGLTPGETVFIGDMEHDIETARHGGIRSCAVLTGYNSLAQLRAARPDLIVEHLGELRGLLERNGLRLALPAATAGDGPPPIVTVGGLIYDADGRVLLVRTHKWSDLWGIPGGKIKWGEPAVEALQRELKEETALDVDQIRFVLVQDCIHSREFYRDAHFVLLNYTCRCVGEPVVVLNDEARDFRWLTPAAAFDLPLNQPTKTLLAAVSGPMPHPE